MRRNRIQVNSGTYCKAPAQFERRMMSQIDLMAWLTDCWLESDLLLEFFRLPLRTLCCGVAGIGASVNTGVLILLNLIQRRSSVHHFTIGLGMREIRKRQISCQ